MPRPAHGDLLTTASRLLAMRVHLGSDHAGLELKEHLTGVAA